MKSVFQTLSPRLQKAFRYLYEQRERPILIAGNGPSLAKIDYSRYPKDPLIVRINNFFFEPEYYIGNHVDCLLCVSHNFTRHLSYYYTLQKIIKKEEYIFADEACICTPYEVLSFADKDANYPIIDINEIYHSNRYTNALFSGHTLSYYAEISYPTTGTLALMMAVLLGFTDIYLAGFDLYNNPSIQNTYMYNIEQKKNMLQSYLENAELYSSKYMASHNTEVEEKAIEWCRKRSEGGLFSLCPDMSIVNNIIPLAKQNTYSVDIKRIKSEDSIQDYLLLKQEKKKVELQESRIETRWIRIKKMKEVKLLRHNIVLRTVYNIFLEPFILVTRIIIKIIRNKV